MCLNCKCVDLEATHSLASAIALCFCICIWHTHLPLYTNGSQRKVCGVQNRVACMQKVRWQPQSLTLTQQHHNKCSKLRLQRTSPFFICLHKLHAFFRLHARKHYTQSKSIILILSFRSRTILFWCGTIMYCYFNDISFKIIRWQWSYCLHNLNLPLFLSLDFSIIFRISFEKPAVFFIINLMSWWGNRKN